MTNRSASPLGKGLKALLPIPQESDEQGATKTQNNSPYFLCPINFINPNPYQPRITFEEGPLNDLANSIKEKGVLQPLIVRKIDENHYELIAGERRLRASKIAGIEKVPVVVRKIAMSDRLELALIENIQRENLNPIDEAEAYAKLINDFSLTQEAVAKRVGKNRSTVANSIRILQLPEDVKSDLAQGKISSGHARVLLTIDNEDKQRALRDQIIDKSLSVREAEILGKELKKGPQPEKKKRKVAHALPKTYCSSLTNSLLNYLGSTTKIIQNGTRGKIEIEYYSPDDLDRLLGLIINEKNQQNK